MLPSRPSLPGGRYARALLLIALGTILLTPTIARSDETARQDPDVANELVLVGLRLYRLAV